MPLFQKVTAGDNWRVPYAEEWNAMLDAGLRARRQSIGQDTGSPLFTGPQLLVKNTSGADVPRYGAIGIDSPRFGPSDNLNSFKNDFAFVGVLPTAAHYAKFALAIEPIAANRYGQCVIGGLAIAKLNIGHADHDYADVKLASVVELASGFHGSARIVWKEAGTGSKWAVVLLGTNDVHEVKGVAVGNIAVDGSGGITVWRNGLATTATETAHLNWMHGNSQVSANKKVLARWFRDEAKWVIVAAECET